MQDKIFQKHTFFFSYPYINKNTYVILKQYTFKIGHKIMICLHTNSLNVFSSKHTATI